MAKSKKWMSLSEAVDHVMRVEKCSHYEAMTKLAEANREGKLPFKTVKAKPPLQPLKPAEAVARIKDDPASVFFTLKEFRRHGGFTKEEVLGELRAGRLIASADDATWFRMQTEGIFDANQIAIAADKVIEWVTNPETPPHLVALWNGEQRRH